VLLAAVGTCTRHRLDVCVAVRESIEQYLVEDMVRILFPDSSVISSDLGTSKGSVPDDLGNPRVRLVYGGPLVSRSATVLRPPSTDPTTLVFCPAVDLENDPNCHRFIVVPGLSTPDRAEDAVRITNMSLTTVGWAKLNELQKWVTPFRRDLVHLERWSREIADPIPMPDLAADLPNPSAPQAPIRLQQFGALVAIYTLATSLGMKEAVKVEDHHRQEVLRLLARAGVVDDPSVGSSQLFAFEGLLHQLDNWVRGLTVEEITAQLNKKFSEFATDPAFVRSPVPGRLKGTWQPRTVRRRVNTLHDLGRISTVPGGKPMRFKLADRVSTAGMDGHFRWRAPSVSASDATSDREVMR